MRVSREGEHDNPAWPCGGDRVVRPSRALQSSCGSEVSSLGMLSMGAQSAD